MIIRLLETNEVIYCAINKDHKIQWVQGSSNKTRYFRTDRYLKKYVKRHNELYPDDEWQVATFRIFEEDEVYE